MQICAVSMVNKSNECTHYIVIRVPQQSTLYVCSWSFDSQYPLVSTQSIVCVMVCLPSSGHCRSEPACLLCLPQPPVQTTKPHLLAAQTHHLKKKTRKRKKWLVNIGNVCNSKISIDNVSRKEAAMRKHKRKWVLPTIK